MSDRFHERILRFLARPGYRPVKLRPLARQMGIAEEEYGEFRESVDALRRVGRVVFGGGNALVLPEAGRTLIGVYRANPRGFGFVVPEDPASHADLFIPPGAALDAVTGDTVECTIERRTGREGKMLSGRIRRIITRGHNRFVGALVHDAGRWFVRPDGNRLHVPILVADVGAKHARDGDQVVVEIIQYPGEGRPARGVIVERLGAAGERGVDVRGIIRQFQLRDEIPPAALEEARRVVDRFDLRKELARREDLRDEPIITIDPDDARDFDDAISIRRFDAPDAQGVLHRRPADGRGPHAVWELGVHIADVSAFVRPDGALDEEARERGNSVYFPRYVIPMLPEILSNGLCSLQEGEPRLCKSAFIRYDAHGRVVSTRFANTVIRSMKRLTYRQAQAVLDGRRGGWAPEVLRLLDDMNALARTIQKRRVADGMISLDLPEIELVFDDHDRVIDAHPADDSFTHTIIEMFMVEANEAVARLLAGARIPFLRRIHPEPDAESGETLSRFLRVAGHELPRKLERRDVQRLLARLKGRPESYAVNLAVLKSMEQAVYSPEHDGHYALASDCYTHFTSPIRRYTDLTIHRLLDHYLAGERSDDRAHRRGGRRRRADVDGEDLVSLGRHLSFTERRAADAERELKNVKILQLLSQHVGESFSGVVTGVANFGVFVQHPKYLLDGLVGLDALPDDYWNVDSRAGCVVGERTRQRIAIGDVVEVEIADVDIGARQLNLRIRRLRHRAARSEKPAAHDRPSRSARKTTPKRGPRPSVRRERRRRRR
ncbi:MAG: ribonuclease R [Phycisphaerae bacterium]|nr:ribonuclease R [Phycisphaerae bacterium]